MSDVGTAKDARRKFRSPYLKALGIVFLPRLIDKMRAVGTPALGGFNYKTAGMDAVVLEFLGVDAEALEGFVGTGARDEEVYAWIERFARRYSADEARALNENILNMGQRTADEREVFEARRDERYPGRTDLRYYVDLIEADESGVILERPLPRSYYDPDSK